MIRDLLESFKYTNHLWPILILRLCVGSFFFKEALDKQASGYTQSPTVSALIDQNLYLHNPPDWLGVFFTSFVQSNWELFSAFQLNFEWAVGFLFLIGFLNRPAALLSLCYVLLISFIAPQEMVNFYSLFCYVLLSLLVFGSGRVGGIDYFFYKRQRGLIW